jgi:hypothetical protein
MASRVHGLTGFVAMTAVIGALTPALASEGGGSSLQPPSYPTPMASGVAPQTLAQSFPVIEFPAGEGTFSGIGVATVGRQADAVLNFNTSNNFSLSLSATGADTLEMTYQGTVTRQSASSLGASGFVLETRVNSFASSLGDWQVFDATGTCRIEVLASRVVSSTCNVTAPAFPADLTVSGLSTEFLGMDQF